MGPEHSVIIRKPPHTPQLTPPSSTVHDTRPDYNVLNNDFLLFQLVLELILRLPQTSCASDDLFKCYSRNNLRDEKKVQEAQRIYIESGSLLLYSKYTFFYAELNESLRCYDYYNLYNFRHLINSLYRELCRHQLIIKKSLIVYRGQIISREELDSLSSEYNQNKFVYWPNFISTSLDKTIALQFAKSSEMRCGYYRILLQIDIHPLKKQPQSKPFASIGHLSPFSQEEEVLLMAGSIFRLCDTKPKWNEDLNVFTVHLELLIDYPEEEFELYKLFEFHKRNLPDQTGLHSVARLFRQMGRKDEEKFYLENLLSQLPNDDLFNCAQVNFECDQYQVALNLFNQILHLQTICSPHANIRIGDTWIHIGDTHVALQDYSKALEAYKSSLIALNMYGTCSDRNLNASVHLRIGRMQRLMGNLIEAETILHNILNSTNPLLLAECLEELSQIGLALGEITNALDYQKRATELRTNHLPEHHPDVSKSYENIADIQIRLPGQNHDALDNYRKARKSFRLTYPFDHTKTRNINDKIRSFSNYT